MIAELRRQVDTSVDGLHSIRARTSRVLAATDAFVALSKEIAALGRMLMNPAVVERLHAEAAERSAFQQELHLLIDQLETLRQSHGAELAQTTLRKPPPKKRAWWQVFR